MEARCRWDADLRRSWTACVAVALIGAVVIRGYVANAALTILAVILLHGAYEELKGKRTSKSYLGTELDGQEAHTMAGATEAEIHEFERRYNVRLPESYREFLANSNGLSPKPAFLMDAAGTDAVALIQRIFSITQIEKFLELFTDKIADWLLLIGRNGGGNYYFLCLETGAVYKWDHELLLDADFKARDLTWLAESVPALLSQLHACPE